MGKTILKRTHRFYSGHILNSKSGPGPKLNLVIQTLGPSPELHPSYPSFCGDIFAVADPDVLMRTLVKLTIDCSGLASAMVVHCSHLNLQPLLAAKAFPGHTMKVMKGGM